jgi:basic membrane protein A
VRPATVIWVLLAVNAVLLVVGAAIAGGEDRSTASGVKIGLVFDIGGKNDESFNTAAWRGLQRAEDELGVTTEFVEPSEGADRESALRALAARHFDLVIGVGFVFGPTLERLAGQYPDVNFAGIDYSPSDGFAGLPNLAALTFREHEGSYLVGAIAGLESRSHTVGFVGGMRSPLILKFEAGYRAGVVKTCPDCKVDVAYAGTDGRAFTDPTLGAELAAAQYEDGADIIFHAAGKTGDGVFAAAKQRDAMAIGVDLDQYKNAPCCVVTSMVKGVDVAVLDIIRDVVQHKFRGGVHELGLAEHGVGFVANEQNRRLLPLAYVHQAEALRDDIIAGRISVPKTVAGP